MVAFSWLANFAGTVIFVCLVMAAETYEGRDWWAHVQDTAAHLNALYALCHSEAPAYVCLTQ